MIEDMSSQNNTVLILSAGKIPTELEGIFGRIPSGLIPINGQPVIFRIIDKLLDEKFSKISITVGYKKDNLISILEQHYKNKIKFDFIVTDHTKAPGNSIVKSLNGMSGEKLLVILGDTLVEDNLSDLITKNKDFVLTSKSFINSENWCLVKQREEAVDIIFDKKQRLSKDNSFHALIGVYFFNCLRALKDIAKNIDSDKRIEISYLLEEYKKHNSIFVIESKQWYDVGHKNNYYASKKKLLQGRYFNYLEYDEIKGIVTKTSDDEVKLINEIKWYQNIPLEFRPLIPNIVECDYSNQPYIKLEHVGFPTLTELWLYGNIDYEVWKTIIKQLFEIVALFKKYQNSVSHEDYKAMYIDKTEQRIENLLSTNKKLERLFRNDFVVINHNKYNNWNKLKEKIYPQIKKLFDNNDNCLVHGDLCFSNILYDLNGNNCKIIDPRGSWGSTVYGDIKYDIAKLRHSIVGNYDSIMNGLYSVEWNNDTEIKINIFHPENYQQIVNYFDNTITKHWDLSDIKLIEGLLFISMLPLHKDNFEKQLALYSVGIQRLNEVIE